MTAKKTKAVIRDARNGARDKGFAMLGFEIYIPNLASRIGLNFCAAVTQAAHYELTMDF